MTAYYPDEEREFGPIMPDYRGPVELSLYAGWSIFSPELDWTTGAVLGGARFTVNGGEESEIGIDFNWGVTRTQYALSEGGATARGEVTVHTFMAGLTYRMSFLRSHLLTPFVRVAMGAVYFDESEFSVRAGTTRIRGKLPASYGWAGQLGLGLDYKLAKNWSFRMESSVDLWITDWREGKHGWEGLVQGNVFQAGIVWHFQ